MARFVWCPTSSASGQVTHARTITQYGDGYSVAVSDGINNQSARWSLNFIGSSAEITPIKSFLDSHAGVRSFDWEPPLGADARWRSEPYTISALGADHYSIDVEFQEVFHP